MMFFYWGSVSKGMELHRKRGRRGAKLRQAASDDRQAAVRLPEFRQTRPVLRQIPRVTTDPWSRRPITWQESTRSRTESTFRRGPFHQCSVSVRLGSGHGNNDDDGDSHRPSRLAGNRLVAVHNSELDLASPGQMNQSLPRLLDRLRTVAFARSRPLAAPLTMQFVEELAPLLG